MTQTLTLNPRGTVTDLVNECTNPSFEISTANWGYNWFGAGGAGTTARVVWPYSYNGGAVNTMNWTTAPSSNAFAGFNYSMAWTPGLVKRISGMMTCDVSADVQIVVDFFNGSGTSVGRQLSTAVTAAGGLGAWVRVTGSFTAPAGSVTASVQFILTGAGTTMSPGKLLVLDAVCITAGSTDVTYFDGSTAASGSYTYAWDGTVGLSTSRRFIPDPATLLTPQFVIGWEDEDTPSRVVHQLLGGGVAVTEQTAGYLRTGTLQLLYKTLSAANAARVLQARRNGVWAYADTDLPETNLSYVVSGPVRLYQDEDRIVWLIDVPFQEVTP